MRHTIHVKHAILFLVTCSYPRRSLMIDCLMEKIFENLSTIDFRLGVCVALSFTTGSLLFSIRNKPQFRKFYLLFLINISYHHILNSRRTTDVFIHDVCPDLNDRDLLRIGACF